MWWGRNIVNFFFIFSSYMKIKNISLVYILFLISKMREGKEIENEVFFFVKFF